MNGADSSQLYARKTLKIIREHKISADPDFYEVIYDYVSKTKPAVSTAIEKRLKENSSLDICFISKLRETHYASDDFSELSEGLNSQIELLTKNVDTSLSSVSDYGSNLRTSASKIKNAKSTSDIVKTIQKLAKDNQSMLARTSSMEKRLQESKKQAIVLNRKLDSTKKLAYTDALTGIANRLQFLNFLSKELKLSLSQKSPLCLIIGDIDHFKRFNDSFGHQIGDQVLRYVGFTLQKSVNDRELCARYGGEEFVIVLPQTGLAEAVKRANSICHLIRKKELKRKSTSENLGRITISLGVALYRYGEIADKLIARADECLYLAKAAGRNQTKSELALLDKTG